MLSPLLGGSLVSIYLILLFLLSPAIDILALGLGVLRVSIFILSRRRYRELMSQDLETQARPRATSSRCSPASRP